MSQQRGVPRGRGRGQSPGSRGARGSSPASRGRGSPAPSAAGTETGYSARGGPTGGGGQPRGKPPRGGGGPSVPSLGESSQYGGGGGQRGGRGSSRGGHTGAPGPAQVFAPGQPISPTPRLNELDQLVQSFKRLQVQPEMPLRPGWGTLGQQGVVRANFFAVRLPAKATYYEYEVAILPKAQAKGDRRSRVIELVEKSPQFAPYVQHIAHDRSQRLVSAMKLPQPLEIPIHYLEEDQADTPDALNFTVEFNFLGELQTSALIDYMSGNPTHRNNEQVQPLISALNLILQQYASKNGVRVGKNKYFFPSSSEHHTLSLGVEAFRGFFTSVRPMYKQLVVNINVCMTAFYTPGKLADAMIAFQRLSSGGMPQAFANRLKVSTRHLGYTRKFTISRIMTGKVARTERFNCEEFGGMITVEDFFRRKYRINLRHATNLPLINVSMKKEKPIYLPAEICDIVPGQAYRGKLDADQTAAMIKVACNPPAFNGDAIVNQGFDDLGLRPNAAESTLAAFGINVSAEMTVVPDRRLPPPSIAYRTGRPQVRDAGWNILDVKLQSGGTMTRWAVLLVQERRRDEFDGTNDPQLVAFLQTFLRKCATSGIKGAEKPPTIMSVDLPRPRDKNDPREAAIEAIRQVFRTNLDRNAKPSFILVLLSGIDKFIYHGIKKLADIDLGVHTVHMLLNKARDSRGNKQDQYFSNVALKVNAKLGGVNHVLDDNSMKWLREKKTMVMGIDVTHPGPGSIPGTPSIAAVVASVDDTFGQFPASLRLQKADWNRESKEMVESVTQMTVERLQSYKKKNSNRLPERIIVYRDGVSEGQYSQVLAEELPRLQAAFKQISPQAPYNPSLTIVVCGKRHHARFYPTDSQHATRNGNTPPGTVMDKVITDIYNFDFYLQAHNGLQGHVKSTHYTVVYDENRFTADVIQQGTHTASYLYARATKAVSLVPAAYYADIACERGRSYLNVLLNTAADDRSSVAGGSRTTADREAEKELVYQKAVKTWGNGVHQDLRESMFYI